MKLKKCIDNHFYNTDGNTHCPYCSVPELPEPNLSNAIPTPIPSPLSMPADMKTVAMWNAPAGTDPVVGWMVCVKGEYFGQSFHLKSGNNNVGRSLDMDVPLAQESTVSRNRHCIITFEPERQEFFIQPGESGGLTYLNGNIVMSFMKIVSRDKINLGSCEFVLYTLCSDKFNWKNVL